MGVQSTISISREAAEAKYVEQKLEALRDAFKLAAGVLSDPMLEDEIESTFYNYSILPKNEEA